CRSERRRRYGGPAGSPSRRTPYRRSRSRSGPGSGLVVLLVVVRAGLGLGGLGRLGGLAGTGRGRRLVGVLVLAGQRRDGRGPGRLAGTGLGRLRRRGL